MNRLVLGGVLLAAAVLASLAVVGSHRVQRRASIVLPHDAAPIRGELIVSTFGDGAAATAPTRHTTVLVPGVHYTGMQDNDLRGFLDGNFKYGWNQPGQTHVRVGRRERSARYGEYELFRVLQRWDRVELPAASRVSRAALQVAVESGPAFPVRVMLYEVKHDWDPGGGGVAGDSVSPPAPGEVWWNERAHGEQPWGLPAAGWAADDPQADTATMPLAECRYLPGATELLFESETLTRYAARRLADGRPLLFLLKLADYHEDLSGSRLRLWSAEHGDSMNPARRPRLTLEWASPRERSTVRQPVFLEYGRHWTTPRIDLAGAVDAAATFVPAEGSPPATVLLRTGGEVPGPWSAEDRMPADGASWLEARILAARNPCYLGETFSSEIRDSWIRSAPPAEQVVPWTFIAPSGRRHELVATYLGDHRYGVEFRPDEIGPWSYSWSHRFDRTEVRSATGRFDVIGGDLDRLRLALDDLEAALGASDAESRDAQREWWMTRFARLERAAMAAITPEEHRGTVGAELHARLDRLRGLLDEAPPETIPLVPASPPDWQADAATPPGGQGAR
jgi:hypothetical protein